MTTRLFFLLLYLITSDVIIGQQHALSTMHMLTPYKYNNAFAGFEKTLKATLIYRNQWSPIENSPSYLHVNTHLPVYILNGGMGMSFESENFGVEQNNRFSLSYNMIHRIAGGTLSGGASLGAAQKKINGGEILTPDGEYDSQTINHADPILPNTTISNWTGTWSINGLFAKDAYKVGIQFNNLFGFKHNFSDLTYRITPEIVVIADYLIELSPETNLIPSILATTNNKNLQINVGALVEYGNIFGGLNLRGYSSTSFESIGITTGVKFSNHYLIAYSFDLGLNALRKSSEGSHEIILSYNLNRQINTGLPPKVIYNPRNL